MLLGVQPVMYDGGTRVLTKQAKGGRKCEGRTYGCINELSVKELPNIAAHAYQDVHVWSAL